ncbi:MULTISPECIES: helix-turn-helix domain-containing protein [Sphingobium]|uniref:helix-turn-helix domain-containing protein n=1 Tax=Sphingobium TaxID=165695 RepID=UPI0015EBFDD7|nr:MULTISPECIES: helix-turn-helix domain-containing protein [Sphingobium]MCW2363055.1 hypothetical protein [Sphingobium sp. B10D3B]MCW2400265.1 hypothetical protein [Sphingobium sp. B10D7B]MCW2407243.1 hypothetical protein [Sphingobium xanthum]
MTIFDSDFESVGAAVPRSAAGIALMVRRLGTMESAYARLIWSRALAEAIEKMEHASAADLIDSRTGEGDARRSARQGDTQILRMLQAHMNLRSPSAVRLLLWLMANPDVFHAPHELRASLGFAESSIKVFVSELRKAFRNKNMPDPIVSFYRRGYCVPADCAALIKDVISRLALEETSLGRIKSPS